MRLITQIGRRESGYKGPVMEMMEADESNIHQCREA
jgi:hypothetical protein